ncbi:MAG: GNAT family N-acetyltransferase [Treponema sp.]|nr:GNAT family N-acetyltransferase [Treponema sp.]
MTFTLSDALVDSILAALENQEQKFLVNAESQALVEESETCRADDEILYKLPEWTSANGFKLREDFVEKVQIPLAREELQNVLHSGRGVFKNYKLVLKKYPEIEKRWHLYKNRAMRTYVNQWYNELREIWGLETLDYIPEADENLLHDDFTFEEYSSKKNYKEIVDHISAAFFYVENLSEDLKSAFHEIWLEKFIAADCIKQIGYVCRSLSDDFAGCITAAPATKKQEGVMILTSLFVPEHFRGLGIATELLSMCISGLKEKEKKWLLLPDSIIPEQLQSLLTRTGFEKIAFGYAVKLQSF